MCSIIVVKRNEESIRYVLPQEIPSDFVFSSFDFLRRVLSLSVLFSVSRFFCFFFNLSFWIEGVNFYSNMGNHTKVWSTIMIGEVIQRLQWQRQSFRAAAIKREEGEIREREGDFGTNMERRDSWARVLRERENGERERGESQIGEDVIRFSFSIFYFVFYNYFKIISIIYIYIHFSFLFFSFQT